MKARSLFVAIFSSVALILSCGNVWATTDICKYSKSRAEINGSGMGGTGMMANGTGIGGTGIRPDREPNKIQIAGTVVLSEGVVEAQGNGYSRLLAKNDPVCVGETLSSSKSGSVHIKMADGGLIALRPMTRLKIEAYTYAKTENDSSVFALLEGSCRFVTGEIGKRYPQHDLIKTPDAIIGVRGTDHEATVILLNEKGRYTAGTYDKVNTGVTYISTTKGLIDIHPEQVGFAANVDQAPVLLRDIPEFYNGAPSTRQTGGSAEEGGKENDTVDMSKSGEPSDSHPSGASSEIRHDVERLESPSRPERPDLMGAPELPELPELPEPPEPITPELP